MANDLHLATTTDSQDSLEAALSDDETAARVPVEQHGSMSDFKHSDSDDGKTKSLSYESPLSSRHLAEEELAEAEAELPALSTAEETEPTGESGDVDIEAVRKAATERAIRDGEALVAQMQAQGLAPQFHIQQELAQRMAEAKMGFETKMNQIRAREPERIAEAKKNIAAAQAAGLDIAPDVHDAIIGSQSVEALVAICSDADALQTFLQLPPDVQKIKIGQIQAQQLLPTAPMARARSNAPAPIKPVGGSPTKSSLPPGEMSYQEYRKWRDAQEKSRYRR